MSPSPQYVLIQTYLDKRDLLLRLFTASLRDHSLAEDVLQDLYIKISTTDITQPIENPLAYLFRAANNIALNRHRAAKSKIGRDQAWQDLNIHSVGTDLVADEVSAEATIIAKQQLGRLMVAFSELSEKSQTILRMHRFDGLSQVEVAKRLNISISTVEKRLSAALKHLVQRTHSQDK